MSFISFDADDLDPTLYDLGRTAGLLEGEPGGKPELNKDWFTEPNTYLAGALKDRPEAFLSLLDDLMGSSSPEVLGLPTGPANGEQWYPISDPTTGEPTGLYLVARRDAGDMQFGLGVRWSSALDALEVSTWAHVPLFSPGSNGSGPSFRTGQGSSYETDSPVQVAVEVKHDDGFGTDELGFRGVKLAAQLLFSETPQVSFVFLGLKLPHEETPSDRALSDLTQIEGREWIEMAVSLFVAQLQAAGDTNAELIRDHLLPIVGLTGDVPSIRWEDLPARQLAVLRDWLQALVEDETKLKAWLGHWAGLATSETGSATLEIEGTGARSDPYRVKIELGAAATALYLTMATVANQDGTRSLYPGVWLTAPPATISGDIKLAFETAVELAAIHLGTSPSGDPLPGLDVRIRLYDESDDRLIDHTFSTGDFADLGTLRLDEIRAGLTLDASHRPVPMFNLVNVQCSRGSWPVLDLSSVDAALDGIGDVAGDLIQQQLEAALGGTEAGEHAGRRVAALLGLLSPTSRDTWPVDLAISSDNVATFLGNPLAAVGCYHARCLATEIDGAPAWRFLLQELAALLRDGSAPPLAVTGTGTDTDPWKVALYESEDESDIKGQVTLQAWTWADGARRHLSTALDVAPEAVSLGDDIELSVHQRTQLLHLDLPPADDCPGPASATWLPGVLIEAVVAGDPRITTPRLTGLELSVEAVAVGAHWRQDDGLDWSLAVKDPQADWEAKSLTLPDLRFGGASPFSWDLSLPDFGMGLTGPDVGDLGDLFRFVIGLGLLERGGPFGFGLAGLFGWLPDAPGFSFPGLPDWELGPFALPDDWPVFSPPSWPDFFDNPFPAIRAHLGTLFSNPDWAWPALRWLGGLWHLTLPDLSLPDLGWPSGDDGSTISFPSIPFEVTGSGTYADPWAVTVYRDGQRRVQQLTWLDPDGPPSGDVVDAALSLLPSALQTPGDLVGDEGVTLENLVTILSALSTADARLRDALHGVAPAGLQNGLASLETWLKGSDGAVLAASQQPVEPADLPPGTTWPWNAPTPLDELPEVHHWAQLQADDVLSSIETAINDWSDGEDLPVLLLGAPWETKTAWSELLGRFGSPTAPHVDLREYGTDPEQISLATVSASARFYTADIAIFNTAPDVAHADRPLPVAADGDGSSQARQVSRLIDRIRALNGDKKVIVVAHSTTGLAARAAVDADPDDARVRGLITVGTPHNGGPVAWQSDAVVRKALAFIDRLDPELLPNKQAREAVKELLTFINQPAAGTSAETLPVAPPPIFTPPSFQGLQTGVSAHAIATRLPQISLRDQVLTWLRDTHLTALRAELDGRSAPTHIGFGVRGVLPPATASGVQVQTTARQDIGRVALGDGADTSGYVKLPRSTVLSTVTRGDGWLVGGVGQNPRLRWAKLGLAVAPGEIEPVVELHNGYADGVDLLRNEVERLEDGSFNVSALGNRLLDEMMRALTREAESIPAFDDVCHLLEELGLALEEGSGYGFDPGGWDALLADPMGFLQDQLSDSLADEVKRDDLLSAIGDWTGLGGLPELLSGDPSDDPAAVTCLREVMAQLGFLYGAGQGYAPKVSAWLALADDPVGALESRASSLLRDEASRVALINHLRDELGLDDVSQPSADYALGDRFTLTVTSSGTMTLSIAPDNPLLIGQAVRIGGGIEVDLGDRTLDVHVEVSPAHINVALAAVYTLTYPEGGGAPATDDWKLQLRIGDSELPFPYDPLDIYPVASDLRARLGELLPRFLLSTFAARILETQLIAQVDSAGPLLSRLGLAHRRRAGGHWQLRPFDGLIADPGAWLLSEEALGTVDGRLDPTKVEAMANRLRETLDLPGDSGTISLPYGLRVRTTSGPNETRLNVETASPLSLPGEVTLGLLLGLGVTPDARVGVGGQIDVASPLPAVDGAWDQVRLQVGYADDSFSLKLGSDAGMISLVPFAGWDAALLNASGMVRQLLPTMVEAAVEALQDGADSDLTDLINSLLTAAAALDVDSVTGVQALVANPVGWIQGQFSSAEASASATAIVNALSEGLTGFSASNGLITYQPGSGSVTIKLGRDARIGAWIAANDLELGPLRSNLSTHLSIDDAVTPTPQFGADVDLAVAPDVIAPGGVSIEPSLQFACNGSFALSLYPLGDAPGKPDFRLDLLPSFQFICENAAGTGSDDMEDCLLAFARRVLTPLAVESFLDNGDVTQWLDKPLLDTGDDATKPGTILTAVGLLTSDGDDGYNLVALDELPDVEDALGGLLGQGLSSLEDALDGSALISLDGGGIYLTERSDGGESVYGVRVAIPEISVSDDPEIVLELGGDAAWVQGAGGPEGLEGGISLYLLRDSGRDDISERYDFDVALNLTSVGVSISGKNDDPLIDVSGFRLDGLDARFYVSLSDLNATPDVVFGSYVKLNEMGLPLGMGSGNAIARGLLGGENGAGGEGASVNPTFSITAAYVGELYLDLGGPDADEAWFPIQQAFGPVHVDQVGVRWDGDNEKLSILVDGGVTIEGFAAGVDDLGVVIPVRHFLNPLEWGLTLRGLAISYSGGGVRITGGLRQVGEGANVRYDGICLVEVAGKTFTALGSFMKDHYTSLFVFVLLPIVIGGPPYLFIIGLAGGFGYNRSLAVPDVSEVDDFSLIAAAQNDPSFSKKPMQALTKMGNDVQPRRGSYWIAAGIKFTSFELVRSVALVYLLLDRGLEVGLLGIAQMELPRGKPLVVIEMALKARFSTREGVFSVEARLTDDSWLLSRNCRLTGGFAFYLWFDGPHQGDALITLGGYHPRFIKPAHYPAVPRLGFNWRVSSNITIKGESYFALTPSCVMAGGLLEASYKSGNLKAWFKAWAHFLIAWRPFAYDIEIGISIGVSYRLRINLLFGTITKTFKVELGAQVWIWGPELSGKAKVTWWVISFTFHFGASATKNKDKTIPWSDFRDRFLPADEDMFGGDVAKGLLEESGEDEGGPWLLKPEFMLRTETVIPANRIRIGARTLEIDAEGAIASGDTEAVQPPDIDIRPMGENNITSDHVVRISRLEGGDGHNYADDLELRVHSGNVPAALWLYEDRDEQPDSKTVPAWVGLSLVADIKEHELNHTGQIPVKKLVEEGTYPLPFTEELDARGSMATLAATANLLDQVHAYGSEQVNQASKAILTGEAWAERRRETLNLLNEHGFSAPSQVNMRRTGVRLEWERTAPPQIASLYEGLAAEPVTDVERTPVEIEPAAEAPANPLVPRLQAIMRQRPKPTRPAARAVTTTVASVTGAAELPRVRVSQFSKARAVGASLRRVDLPQASRPTSLAGGSAVFINDRFATAKQRDEFRALQQAAVVDEGGEASRPFSAAVSERTAGIGLRAGMTHVWELPSRDTVGDMPVLRFEGDQAIRITCFDRGSGLLADVEMVGSGSYRLPPRTARFAVSGLGRPSQLERVTPSMGAVSMKEATHPVPAVGWLGTSALAQVTRSALLGRGAVVKTGAPVRTRRRGRRVDQAFLQGGQATRDQEGLETHLPSAVTTVGVLLERQDSSADRALAEGLRLSVSGGKLSDRPRSVVGSSRAMLLYDVLETDEDRPFISLKAASRPSWHVDGVIGLTGTAAHWADILSSESLTTLVEDGPLTPQGHTQLVFQTHVSGRNPR